MSGKIVKYVILLIAVSITIIPLFFMFSKSFEGNGFYNYVEVIRTTNMGRSFINSIIVTVSTIVLQVVFISMAAYAFSKTRFPFKDLLFLLFLSALMVPGASILFPSFLVIKKLGLIDNFFGLIGPYIAFQLPFNLLILKNFYDNIPNDFIDSASIDGCSSFKTLWLILFPMSMPALIVIVIWIFLGCWNEYMFAFIFINKPEMRTLTILPSKFISMFSSKFELVFATLVIIELPVILLYILTQSRLQSGLTAGAIKG